MKLSVQQIEPFDIVPGYHARFIHSTNMTFSYVEIDADARLPEHSHYHEQVINLLEGKFELTLAGEKLSLEPGNVVIIPPNMPHSGLAKTRCRILDVFHPIREDFVKKQVNYGTQ